MRRIIAFTVILLAVCFIAVPQGFSEPVKTITVQAPESVKEALRDKGPGLYIRIGIYRGY